MPWVALYRDPQKLTDKRENMCKKGKVPYFQGWHTHVEKMYHAVRKKKNVSYCQKEKMYHAVRKKKMYHTVRKEKNVSCCQKEKNVSYCQKAKKCIKLSERKYYIRPQKKLLIGLQKYTCHLKRLLHQVCDEFLAWTLFKGTCAADHKSRDTCNFANVKHCQSRQRH